MILAGWEGSEVQLLVFKMLFNFIFPTEVTLSLLVLGHDNDSIRGSNIRSYASASRTLLM